MSEALPEAPACQNGCRDSNRVYSEPKGAGYRLFVAACFAAIEARVLNCTVPVWFWGGFWGFQNQRGLLLLLSPLPLPLVHG